MSKKVETYIPSLACVIQTRIVFTLSDKNEKRPAKFSIVHFAVRLEVLYCRINLDIYTWRNDSSRTGGVITLLLCIELYNILYRRTENSFILLGNEIAKKNKTTCTDQDV